MKDNLKIIDLDDDDFIGQQSTVGQNENSEARAVTEQRNLGEGVSLDDFHAIMPMHAYVFAPTGETWPAASVNSRIGPVHHQPGGMTPCVDKIGKKAAMAASVWLDLYKPVEQVTWAPGEPMLIRDRLIAEGGWIVRPGVTCFNFYRPPTIERGDPEKAGPWLDHVRKVYDDQADHIIKWLAHRVQTPGVKVNHGLVLGGAQGIGKDTLLEPVKHAVGPWNFTEVSPQQVLGRFNGFLKSVILRVSEARDLGDVNRFAFYDHMKGLMAAPPDVLRCDEKYLREHSVLNVCGVVITTNHKGDGIYLPADDRRHFVAWSDKTKEDFSPEYWRRLWGWYEAGGCSHVAAYLANIDLADCDAKAPPPKTAAFWEIVDANRAPEDAELADVLDRLGNPAATTLDRLANSAPEDFRSFLTDRRNRRAIPHRLEDAGYEPVRNTAAKDGLWKIGGRRQAVYARKDLSISERIAAVRELTDQ